MKIEQLIEDYKRRIETLQKMLDKKTDKDSVLERTRLTTKLGCYRTFVAGLQRELNK